jgi:hypothetical protein
MSLRRKCADLLTYFNPFTAMNLAPPPKDEDIPAAKRPRLEASTSTSVFTDPADAADTTDTLATVSPDDAVAVAPTDAVTATASLPSTGALRAYIPRRAKRPRLEAPDDAVAVAPTDAVTVAASVPGAGGLRAYIPRRTKRPRLEASTGISTATDAADTVTDTVTIASSDEVAVGPTYDVTVMGASCARAPPRTWKPEEDAKLVAAVKKHGDKWVAVAALVPGRANAQCRIRWLKSLDPAIRATARKENILWSAEEDAFLTEAQKKHGNDWARVAAMVPGRTNVQCCARWRKFLGPNMYLAAGVRTAGKWTAAEDAKLIEGVRELGERNWVAVAALVPGRTHVQCYSRWYKYLGPSLDPTTACNTGPWKSEEDAMLIAAVTKIGKKDWVKVAAIIPGRTNYQCSGRWVKYLDPTLTGRPHITMLNGQQQKTQR